VTVFNTSDHPIVGIIETQEMIPASNGFLRGYAYSVYVDKSRAPRMMGSSGRARSEERNEYFEEGDPPAVVTGVLDAPTSGTSTFSGLDRPGAARRRRSPWVGSAFAADVH